MLINNPLKGRHHSNKTKEKMRLAKIGKPSKRKRVVTIDGISYESVTEAMSILGLSTRALYRKLGE